MISGPPIEIDILRRGLSEELAGRELPERLPRNQLLEIDMLIARYGFQDQWRETDTGKRSELFRWRPP